MRAEFHRLGWTWWLVAMWVAGEIVTIVLTRMGMFPLNFIGAVGYVGAPCIAIVRARSIRKRQMAALMMITSDF